MSSGITREDLPEMRRELFMAALDVARHDHDPNREWDAFCELAWREAGLAFGFIEREEAPPGWLPDPSPVNDVDASDQRDSPRDG